MRKKLKSLRALGCILKRLKGQHKKIVFTNGCFDILHAGHTRYLQISKRYGDILVVAINSDRSVRQIKGRLRPVTNQTDRAIVLSALESVDYVTIFDGSTPIKVIKALKPDVLVKGGDWKKEDIVGGEFVESYGGEAVTVPYINGYSTSEIIDKITNLHKTRSFK